MLVVRAQGVQSEAEVAFGGLLEVARPLLARIDELPERQAAALRAALALDDGPSPDRLTVGAATLSLLAAAAEETPLLVALDDAHWLDAESAAALGFAVRRLQAERVAVVCATRVGEGRGLDPAGLGASSTFRACRARTPASSSRRNGVPGAEAATRVPCADRREPAGAAGAAAMVRGRRGARRRRARRAGSNRRASRGRLCGPRRCARPDTTREALLVLAASSTEDAAAIIAALEAGRARRRSISSRRRTPASSGFHAGDDPLPASARPLGPVSRRGAVGRGRAAHSALASALEERDPEGGRVAPRRRRDRA